MVWLEIGHYIYQRILELEYWNLVHTLGGPFKLVWGNFILVRLELVPVLNCLTWNWTFTYISKYFCYRLQIWHTPWGDQFKNFGGHYFLVRLELVPVLNGLTWNWTFTYISKYLWYRLETWYTPWGDQFKNFWGIFFLVRLERVTVLNGLTWNCTFIYSRIISALGLVSIFFCKF